MATTGSSAPPPPPPGGPGKTPEAGHNVSKITIPIQKIRDRYDGKSARTARPTEEIIKNSNQTQYLVHCRFDPPPAKWQKCSRGEARYFAETGYPVLEIRGNKVYEVELAPRQQPGTWDSAADRQIREVVDEEVARVQRYEHLSGEDIMDNDGSIVSTEHEDEDNGTPIPGFTNVTIGSSPPFGGSPRGNSPPGMGTSPPFRGPSMGSSPPAFGSSFSSRPGTATGGFQSGSPRSPQPPYSTPTRQGPGSSPRQQEGHGSPTPQGRGFGSAGSSPQGQDQGSPHWSKGKGPRRDGSGGAAST